MSNGDNSDIKLNQGGGNTADADKKILNSTDRFSKTDSSRIQKSDLDDVNTKAVVKPSETVDPLTLRDSDTSKLKRIKPKSATQTISLDSENISDTVHLKIIKEKKKQLAGILTASQTIRLRPPSTPSAPAAPQSSQTLKIGGSAAGPGGTVNLPPGQAGAAGTLKINMPASSSESGTIKVSRPNFGGAPASSAGTLRIKSPVSVDSGSSAGGTLKIKGTATAGASGTLKIKAAAGASQTVKMGEGTYQKGGTLKLKAKSTVSSPAPTQRRQATAAAEEVQQLVEEDPKAKPGIFITLSSLVALSAIAVIVFKAVDSYMKIFTIHS